MTLEDFFTLTEMKNGLATPSRVEEMLSIMQQQKDCAMNNLSDIARQWSTVASTIAATENKDCLTHFVKSNGLGYLNQWLQEALKCSTDVADIAVDELLNALLGSLERLAITKEDSVTSGIQFVVEQLVGSKSINIKEKARNLCERWKHAIGEDVGYQDMNKDEKYKGDDLKSAGVVCVVDGGNLVPSQVVDISTCREVPEESNNRDKSAGCMDNPQPDTPCDLLTSTENKSIPSNANSEDMDTLPCTSKDVADGYSEEDDNVQDRKMEVDENEGCCPSESKSPLISNLSFPSFAHKPERSVSCNFDAKEIKLHKSETMDTLPRSASIDCLVPKYLRNVEIKPDMQDILSKESKLRSKDDFEQMREIGSKGRLDTVDSLKAMNRKSIVGMDQSSELGLEYGEIDALEVARQVAIEVEREVVDYREPFCSSSPECNSSEEMEHEDQTINVEENGKGHDDASPPKDVEMSNLASHETSDKKKENRCVFDLNEDVYVEESPDSLINVSAPIAVAASKGAPLLPGSPLRFEGELGWKGSAATSAFRPASPRRTLDVEKTSSGHKRKANLIEIDLNVADIGDDLVEEDSTEVCSSSRADRLMLDLNRVEEEDMPPIPLLHWSIPHLNGNQTVSPVSSSSSRQPSLRNFDLNDNPSFFDAMGSHNHMKNSSRTEIPQSLMGHGPTSIMPYGHFPHHAYGYNGHMVGPTISFPPPLFGHGNIPYMVDSRGAAIVPQILSTVPSAIPPFLMSATNTSLGLNGAGTSQSGLELNSMENGNLNNFFLQGHNALTEDEVRAASQPGGSMNRKDADSGWEPYNFVASWK